MNIDELKELEGEWRRQVMFVDGKYSSTCINDNDGNYLFSIGGHKSREEKWEIAGHIIKQRNSAKEMFETIERYKAALEKCGSDGIETDEAGLRKIADEAVKEPENTGDEKG